MEEVVNKYGKRCYIDNENVEGSTVLVQFYDSNIKKYASIEKFRAGKVSDVVKASRNYPVETVHKGERRKQGDYWVELVFWDTSEKCTFKVDILNVVIMGSYKDFYDGVLIPVNGKKSKCVLEQMFMLKAKTISCENNIVLVEFEDGTRCKARLETFLSGKLILPGIKCVKGGIYFYNGKQVLDVDYNKKRNKITLNTYSGVIDYDGGIEND